MYQRWVYQVMKKRIVIIGGGVIGLATAYELIKSGHQVQLLERQAKPGLATSFANGGQLSYRYVAPLADRGVPLQGMKWMGKADSPLNMRLKMSADQWRWLLQFLRACNSQTNKLNGDHILRLSLLSRQVMQEWLTADNLHDFHWRRSGKLIVHRRTYDFNKAAKGISPHYQQALNADECIQLEPALKYIHPSLQGGIYSPGDETADCQKFCQALLEKLHASASFTLTSDCEVLRLNKKGARIDSVDTRQGTMVGDEYIVAAGNGSGPLLAGTGIRVPLCALKGYSLTLPYPTKPGIAPDISVTDYGHKVVYARLGDRLRIAAMVDIGYDGDELRPERIQALKKIVTRSFPELQGVEDAEAWCGMRPSTPAGPPLLGRAGYQNLWMNLGQGSLGFTLAAGSAVVLGALLNGASPAISLEGLTWEHSA
ncbi:TPA: D-amino acid dehydrogenase [Raoultella ornithinolytica]|uniref:D-amino acid dehydrogenase n=2 Tax=Raoultella TaxID=160674 RepID=UPI001D0CFE97|nr:D-amino acid dehydrogenase [Raoultella ornithinolytica]MCZ0878160.1 D-amino acid dehydrogenase [Raoultella ornithinolytica]MDX7496757.1 D-amino acid dehydrogenase [Raoultella ornithinolytica]MEC5099405.1 D-amino acid dehydrogenase [Raoultella ornithinolytica]MEC5107485.1 D-amino acid dehydrogenase [Raoultella ornithinolytica]